MHTKRNKHRGNDTNRLPKIEDENDDHITEDEVSEEFIRPKRRRLGSEDNRYQQWIDKYTPKIPDEICINPRKLKEVKEVLLNMIKGSDPTKLLILTGPSGCSKSTTIKVLANDLISRMKSENKIQSYFPIPDSFVSDNWIEYIDSMITDTPQPTQFSEFLNDAKYRTGSNLSIILVEELPNIFHPDTLTRFRANLNEWVNTSIELPPLVLCLTEIELAQEQRNQDHFNIENNLSVDTLLGRGFLNQFGVKHIKFNSIAATFMKKSMSQIINKEKQVFRGIAKTELNNFLTYIIESGDIRSAISNLQFWSGLSKKGRGEVFDSLRENQLNLFHAIGKVIYSSSKFQELPTEENDYLTIQSVLENYGNNSLLNLSLLENYTIYNDLNYDLDIASDITDSLSLSDLMGYVEEGKEIGVRSTRNQLRRVDGRRTQRTNIKFPRHFKMIKEFNKTKREIRTYQLVINECRNSFNDLNLVDGFYLPIIYNATSRQTEKLRYDRLGGRFKQILSDTELPVLEEATDDYIRDQFHVDIQEKLNYKLENEEDIMSDPIESDVDSDDDIFNDSIDDRDVHRLVTQSRSQSHPSASDDEFLSDPELDNMIQSGKY